MIENAVNLLMSTYNNDKEIAEIKEKRKIVSDMLKIYSHDIYNKRLDEIKKLKADETDVTDKKLFFIREFENFEIFEIQYIAYNAMSVNIMNYDKLLSDMKNKIKKTKSKYNSIREMVYDFKNIKLEWS